MANTLIGFQRLAQMHDIEMALPLFTESKIGTAKQRLVHRGREYRDWTQQYQPADTFRGHFEFGLKYERISLEFFSRLFEKIDPAEIAAWLAEAPMGSYARRTAFFYEWLTGRRIDAPDTAVNVGYADAIDADEYLAAQTPDRIRRWRVNNNLPGPREFCPLIYLGPQHERDWFYDVGAGVKNLDKMFGPELLLRSSAWLTFKESRASFAIEREADKDDRVKRFAAAIAEFSGRLEDPMGVDGLIKLQTAVLGDGALRMGVRRSPVFVGQTTFNSEVVHYIAPSEALVEEMLEGIRLYEVRTRGADPLARAAAISFAFVYLHPLADGNGRVHRFLINHILAADNVVPPNIIVPLSATIAATAAGRAAYDQVLESVSRPFMRRYGNDYRFGNTRRCEDGVVSDFEFLATEDAQHAWRYLDLSDHVRYLSDLLRTTVEHEMAEEAMALRQYDAAREAIKRVVEMPDSDADRIIRSLTGSGWTVSGKLAKTYPEIFTAGGSLYPRHEALVLAVKDAFTQSDSADEISGAEQAVDQPPPDRDR